MDLVVAVGRHTPARLQGKYNRRALSKGLCNRRQTHSQGLCIIGKFQDPCISTVDIECRNPWLARGWLLCLKRTSSLQSFLAFEAYLVLSGLRHSSRPYKIATWSLSEGTLLTSLPRRSRPFNLPRLWCTWNAHL